MPIYAECFNNRVSRISQRPVVPVFVAPIQAIDLTNFSIHPAVGDIYDPETQVFTAPGAAGPTWKKYTYQEFIEACLDSEIDSFISVKRGNSAASIAVERFLLKTQARGVDCSSATVQAAFASMVQLNILTQERANILLGVAV